MATRTKALLVGLLLVLVSPSLGRAERFPCGDLVLPYFEVQVTEPGQTDTFNRVTTAFSVGNCSEDPLTVRLTVWSNWGIPLPELTTDVVLDPMSIFPVNLRDWIVFGTLPDRQLGSEELAHVQAALCGEPSPRDGLYYATLRAGPIPDADARIATGFVSVQVVAGPGGPDDLWGDFFVIRPDDNSARGESLVRIVADPSREICNRHLIRFLEGGAFDAGTHFVFWTGLGGFPGADPEPAFELDNAHCLVYDEAGNLVGERDLPLLPTQAITVADLDLPVPFGWVDCTTRSDSFVCVDYSAEGRFGVALRSFCEAPRRPGEGAEILIQKLTDGMDADVPTGPVVLAGSPVEWTYVVTNTGEVTLSDLAVRDDDRAVEVSCPGDELAPGEQMVCTATGVCGAGQYRNVGFVMGRTPDHQRVTASDPSHCYGMRPAITLQKYTDGVDADLPPGPLLTVGNPVTWTYIVTNTGDVPLSALVVTDDQGVAVTCPGSSLVPGEQMTCSASGTVAEGLYVNVGTVTGSTAAGELVQATDPSHCHGVEVGIELEKLTDGEDADTPPGPMMWVGEPVSWTYIVTNTGDAELTGISVTDSKGVPVTCPGSTLAPGASMTCTASGTMTEGQYSNLGTVVGTAPDGTQVSADDPSHCVGRLPEPALDVEKLTNGFDADLPPGPYLLVGSPVEWTYIVTNTGNADLSGVTVTDDQGAAVTCPGSTLAVGESMTCTASGIMASGAYANLGTATGMALDGREVGDEDPSHCFGADAGIHLEKYTNGVDADEEPGPTLPIGTPVQWTYVASNVGNMPLTGVAVSDDHGLVITCPGTELAVGASMTCTACALTSVETATNRLATQTGAEDQVDPCLAQAGQYANLGTAAGTAPDGSEVTDDDPSHYFGEEGGCDEGCTPGYWKNHQASWPATGYTTGQTVDSVFAAADAYGAIGDSTLLQALDFGGGPGVGGAAQILLRAAVAGLLNASHPEVGYCWTPAALIASVDFALAGGDRDAMLVLASVLDQDNNRGCPLS